MKVTSEPSPSSRAYVRFLLRHARVIGAIAVVLSVLGTIRTVVLYAHLRSELEQLLPRSAPSVLAIDELRARVSGLQYLGVVVDVGSAENIPAGERFLDDLAARVRAYPPDLVRTARLGDTEERAFLEKNAALYLETDDLRTVLQRIEARRDWEVSHATGASLDDDDAPPLDFSDIEKKYDSKTQSRGRLEHNRFSNAELKTTLLLIEAGSFSTGQGKGAELLRRVKADIASLGGTDAYAKGMRQGFSGDIAISVEETSALVADLSLSSVLVAVFVIAVLLYYFRWWRSLLVLLPPLFVATVLAFGLASFPPFSIHELNSNTAFLGSIIVGNGINVGIILLSRYVEERRKGMGVEASLEIAVWGARPGTLSAALAASVSYISLVLTDFRGFRQFGIIGGLGMVLAWVTAFVLMPPLIRAVDRDASTAPKPFAGEGIASRVARLVKTRPAVVVVVAALMTSWSMVELARIDDRQLENDFSKLRRRDTWKVGEGYWGRKMDALLGSYLTPTAILADDSAHAKRIEEAIRQDRQAGVFGEMVSSVRTIDDVLPHDQKEKLAIAADIREAMTPKIRSLLPDNRRATVERILDGANDQPIAVNDLPRIFTTGLREKDGSFDKIVLVYPKPSKALWDGPALASFVTRLRDVAARTTEPGHPPARVAGSLALSTDILESIRRDGPKASFAALAGVIVVVLLLFRLSVASLKIIGSLLVGVSWLVALTVLLHVKINFANFIAFPITFGIGVDYAVNVMSRYLQGGSRDTEAAVRATGGAVALCSATTIIGYSSLLVAENQALFLFGLLAVLGEITCLVAAVVALPALLELQERWHDGRSHTPAE